MWFGKSKKKPKKAAAPAQKPLVMKIGVLKSTPGDVIVLNVPMLLTEESRKKAWRELKNVFPHNRVIVCDGGAKLSAQAPYDKLCMN